MRVLSAIFFLALGAGITGAQSPVDSARHPVAGKAAAKDRVATRSEIPDSLRSLVGRVRRDPAGFKLPSDDSLSVGNLVVPAGVTRSSVAVVGGNLEVLGTITGDAIAVGGDVIVRAGGHIAGNAEAAAGRVRIDGGTVEGEIRSLEGAIGAAAATATNRESPVADTKHSVSLALGWLLVLAMIGIGVLVFAGNYLDAVVDSLEGHFARSLWVGIGAQLALVPVFVLLCVALTLTIIGVLLVPFAVVAYVLAVAGLATLGFLAVARVTGDSIGSSAARRLTSRGASLRAVIIGVMLYMGLWVLAAAFTWAPIVSLALRIVALAVTWVAASAGFGAAIISRAGTRRATTEFAAPAEATPLAWQTPTPITGVVAARRPVARVRES